MPRPSSSISNSDSTADSARSGLRSAAVAAGWVVFWLAVIDAIAGLTFSPAKSDEPGLVGQFASYFERGMSSEARLRRRVDDPTGRYNEMLASGWVDPEQWRNQNSRAGAGQEQLVAFYGNSLTRQVASVVAEQNPDVGVRMVFGPIAPPSHAYACFLADRGLHAADVVVLGVSSNTVAGVLSMTRITQSIVEPLPYTYTRYFVEDGDITAVEPMVSTLAELRAALAEPAQWQRHSMQLAEFDEFYSARLFNASVLDHSMLAKLLRAALAIRREREVSDRVKGRSGFQEGSEATHVLRAILRDFGSRARSDGRRALVLVMSTIGDGDGLDKLLRESLAQDGIEALYSNDVCPSTDRDTYQDDGHFSPDCARAIAEELIRGLRMPEVAEAKHEG